MNVIMQISLDNVPYTPEKHMEMIKALLYKSLVLFCFCINTTFANDLSSGDLRHSEEESYDYTQG